MFKFRRYIITVAVFSLINFIYAITPPPQYLTNTMIIDSRIESINRLTVNDVQLKNKVVQFESIVLAYHKSIIDNSNKYNITSVSSEYSRFWLGEQQIESGYIYQLNKLPELLSYKNSHPDISLVYYPVDPVNESITHHNNDLYINNKFNGIVSSIMLQNQREPLSFVIQNLSHNDIVVNKIDILLSDSYGKHVPNSWFDVNLVKNWHSPIRTFISSKPYEISNPHLTPELLIKDDKLIQVDDVSKKNYLRITSLGKTYYQDISSPNILMPKNAEAYDSKTLQTFTLRSYNSQQIWVNVTSDTSIFGNLSGFIQISYIQNGVKKLLKIPLKINVLPVVLSPTKLKYGVYYAGQLRDDNGLKALEKSEQQYFAEMQDLMIHGVYYPNNYIGGASPANNVGSDPESSITFYLKVRKQLGFPCDMIFFNNGMGNSGIKNLSVLESNVYNLRKLVNQNTNCYNESVFLYGIDEARGKDLTNQQLSWDKVHQSGGLVYASSFSKDISNYVESLDLLVFRFFDHNESVVDVYRAKNKDVFLYGNPQSGIPNSLLYRKGYGYLLIKDNFTGAMDFAYQISFPDRYNYDKGVLGDSRCYKQESGSYCSAWNNFDSNLYYDHMFTYPTTNGVIDTVQWEGYAAAITDTRYYYTLIDLLEKNCKPNDIRCNFDPMSLINTDDPSETRQKIIEKIKIFVS